MDRLCLLAAALLPLQIAVVAQQGPEHTTALLTISLYAPFQPGSPVHIVGFEHTEREIQFELSNASDRTVTGVIIESVARAPSGCAKEETGTISNNAQRFQVRIAPHGLGVATRENAYFPKLVVYEARSLGAARLHAQVAVIGVYFEDGSTWPVHFPPAGPSYASSLFDPRVVEAEPGTCINVAAVVEALGRTNEVVFEAEGPSPPEQTGVTVPHLNYSCRFDGPKAICRLPLDGDQTARPRSSARKN